MTGIQDEAVIAKRPEESLILPPELTHLEQAMSTAVMQQALLGRERENNLRKVNNFQNILLCWEANPFRAQKLMFWAILGNKCNL